jgi:hypothetical protein
MIKYVHYVGSAWFDEIALRKEVSCTSCVHGKCMYLYVPPRFYWRFYRNIVADALERLLQCCDRISNRISYSFQLER